MKLLTVRLIPIALITLVYLLLLPSDFLPELRPLNPFVSMSFNANGLLASPIPLRDGVSNQPKLSFRSDWLQLLAWFTLRSTARLKQRGLESAPNTNLRTTEIGGAWRHILPSLANASLSSPATITFTGADDEHIIPSLDNGYINSRIDLRRRRRALSLGSREVAHQSSVALYVREDDLIRSRAIDPLQLAGEFRKAAFHNRVLEDELAVRRSRRAKKKRKGVNGKNST